MSTPQRAARAASFGSVAASYERSRPGYPADAVQWLIGDRPAQVLDLGAGTGKFTRALVAGKHRVAAVEPSPTMLAELQSALPDVDAHIGSAEIIPADDESFDVVVVAQAFHWFDKGLAVPEITRVLRHGGRLALVWNLRDESAQWVRDVWSVIAPDEPQLIGHAELPPGSQFGPLEYTTFPHHQLVDRQTLLELALSRSYVAASAPERQSQLLETAGKIFDQHTGGKATLTYITHCYRTQKIR